MKILYENLLESATLSATNEDPNYPVENVYGNSLCKKFMADTNSSVITADLDEESTVSTFAFGNHNIDTLSIQLTDSDSVTTTYNYTSSDLVFSSAIPRAMIYITPIENVVEIEYTITSTDALYIGGLSVSQSLELRIESRPKIYFNSSGEAQKSKGGVTFDNEGIVLESFECSMSNIVLEDYNLINAFFSAVQTYRPHWIDREITGIPVLFAQQLNDLSYTMRGDSFVLNDLSLEWEECK